MKKAAQGAASRCALSTSVLLLTQLFLTTSLLAAILAALLLLLRVLLALSTWGAAELFAIDLALLPLLASALCIVGVVIICCLAFLDVVHASLHCS